MPLPPDLYEEDRNYRLRLCLLVAENPILGMLTGSIVHLCDRCAEPIWVDEKQEIPPLPEEVGEVHGDLSLCIDCIIAVNENHPDPQPMEWLEQIKKIREDGQ